MKAGDLEYVKRYVSGDLDISHEELTSLEGCPEKVDGYFGCINNLYILASFEYFPKYIDGSCYINNNNFTSFKNIDQHIKFIGDELFALDMDITSGYSDLFSIDGLRRITVENIDIQQIANKYLPKKDIINFQDEMIKAGFEKYL